MTTKIVQKPIQFTRVQTFISAAFSIDDVKFIDDIPYLIGMESEDGTDFPVILPVDGHIYMYKVGDTVPTRDSDGYVETYDAGFIGKATHSNGDTYYFYQDAHYNEGGGDPEPPIDPDPEFPDENM